MVEGFLQQPVFFTESKQGKHSQNFILDNEELRYKAALWIRKNATLKGKPNMTGTTFSAWVNTDLLPTAELSTGFPTLIQPRTAIKWLHRLGFQPQSHKKSIYIDGHEREDVIDYRKIFSAK